MNSIYKKGVCLLTAVMALVLLAACSSDNDSYDVPGIGNITRDMIVGEWYEPNGEGSYGIGNYKADGSLSSTTIKADKNAWSYSTGSGYWELSDGQFTVVTYGDNSGLLNTNTKAVYRFVKLTKYEIQLSSLDMDLLSGGYRIVDTYQMNVGESRQAIINDGDFVPQGYSSVNHHVASVDNEGNIEARHLGTTYILITSSIGTAVIRVVVNDSANDFDDALQIMGLPLKSVTKEYGQIYIEQMQDDATTVRVYNLADEKVMQIQITTDTEGYVGRMEQRLSNNITSDEVRASLNRKYDYYRTDYDENERIDWYITQWQCRMVAFGYHENQHLILLHFIEDVRDIMWYEDLFSQVMNMDITLQTVARVLGYTMTADDYARGWFRTSASYPYKEVLVVADEQGYADMAQFSFDDHITYQDFENFLLRFYIPTPYLNTYYRSGYDHIIQYEEGEDGYMQYLLYKK